MTRALAVGALIALAGCGGARLRGQAKGVRELIATARENGAIKCAPVELAMAESHEDFARQELNEGNYYAARFELGIASQNAQAAFDKSPKERCAPRVVVEESLDVERLDTDGDGIYDDVDECPKIPEDKDGFQDEDGCPDTDNDNDGILDKDDACPNDPEDKDGFQDEDGCPDPDNDGDGLADKVDQCPDQPEDKDGDEDDDGCPEEDKYKLVVVTEKKIELKQTIYFDFKKATIKPVSYPLLNEVAQVLKDRPTIEVRIEGHTDSIGGDAFNMRLSRARATSVREYLIGQGVDPSRMVAQGYGETMPLADNRTQEGRDQNRRVEFFITRQ